MSRNQQIGKGTQGEVCQGREVWEYALVCWSNSAMLTTGSHTPQAEIQCCPQTGFTCLSIRAICGGNRSEKQCSVQALSHNAKYSLWGRGRKCVCVCARTRLCGWVGGWTGVSDGYCACGVHRLQYSSMAMSVLLCYVGSDWWLYTFYPRTNGSLCWLHFTYPLVSGGWMATGCRL